MERPCHHRWLWPRRRDHRRRPEGPGPLSCRGREDRRRVEELRKRGLTAIYGDATAAGVLEAAGVAHARLLILVWGLAWRASSMMRRFWKPCGMAIETAVRTHRASEIAYLKNQGVG